MVLDGHRCRLEGLNMVQVRCFLAIHDLNTYDSLALVLKVSGAGILLCWESDDAKFRIVSRQAHTMLLRALVAKAMLHPEGISDTYSGR
jgi:hypothetical protein